MLMRGIHVIPFIREMELWELWECFFLLENWEINKIRIIPFFP